MHLLTAECVVTGQVWWICDKNDVKKLQGKNKNVFCNYKILNSSTDSCTVLLDELQNQGALLNLIGVGVYEGASRDTKQYRDRTTGHYV